MYREINASTDMILTQMTRLIAEVGDMHRFYSSSALIVYTGIDAPAYQMDLCIFFTDSADLE